MPDFEHVVSSNYKPTFRTEKVAGMFDLNVSEKMTKKWDVNFPIESIPEWGVGLIVGSSGTGKTTLSKKIFGDSHFHNGFEWDKSSLIDDFRDDIDVSEICKSLTAVGFSSPPSWLLPFSVLSNGQKFRAEVARCILEKDDLVVFDEFTSVVDRKVAKIGSYAVQKYIRSKPGKQFVAVTCHYDVEEWLMPDWVYDVSTGEFRAGRLERRPKIECKIQQCDKSVWGLFKDHHYLTGDINRIAKWYVMTIDDEPVAVTSTIHFPNGKYGCVQRGHRTVVLPDYQGIGLANVIVESVADKIVSSGGKYYTSTSHPAMIHHRLKSPLWRTTAKPCRIKPHKDMIPSMRKSLSVKRIRASFEYIGKS